MPKASRPMVVYAIKEDTKKGSIITWYETIQVGNKSISVKVDTGSEVNLLSQDTIKHLTPKPKLYPTEVQLSSYSGHPVNIHGVADIKCVKNGKHQCLKFFITNLESVLGLQACIDFGIVTTIPASLDAHGTEKILRLYDDVFGTAEVLKCKPYQIRLIADAKPTKSFHDVLTAPQKQALREALEKMEELGILVDLDGRDSGVTWSHPFVLLDKVYMDCRPLNRYIIVEKPSLPIIEDLVPYLKQSQCFSILRADQTCIQIPLDEASSEICTIATPCGKFKFKTIPYGLAGACQVYHNLATQMFANLDGVVVYMQEILVHGRTKEEHNGRLVEVLERARKNNLKFSKTQMQLAKPQVTFMGYRLAKNDVAVDKTKVEAMMAVSAPSSKQELQSILEILESSLFYLPINSSQFKALKQKVLAMASTTNKSTSTRYTQPYESLKRMKEKFPWSQEQEAAFCALKVSLCDLAMLKAHNPNKPLYITVAASRNGLGAVARQDLQPLGYFSRAFNSAQLKYSQVEKKLLAILTGLESFYFYTHGKEVVVQVDHRPLLALLREPFHVFATNTASIILKLLQFRFKLEYVAGKDLAIAYVLSRNPLKPNDCEALSTHIVPSHSLLCASQDQIVKFKESLKEDPVLPHVIAHIQNGWPKYSSWIRSEVRRYFGIKDQLRYIGGLLFYGNKLVVPQKEKDEILQQLHSSHQTVKACQQNARLVYYWPSMLKDIEAHNTKCEICHRVLKSASASVVPDEVPERPWSKIAINFTHVARKQFLVIVDCFSKFLLIKTINVKTAKSLICVMEDIFASHGLPLEIRTNNSPPFNTHVWKSFLTAHDIKLSLLPQPDPDQFLQITTSLIRTSIAANVGLFLVVMKYNATPIHDLPSPSELLMGRRLRTKTLLVVDLEARDGKSVAKTNEQPRRKSTDQAKKI